jgi:hypothetical protein
MNDLTVDAEYSRPIIGTITAAAQTIDLISGNNSTISIQLEGTWSGIILVEASQTGNTYVQLSLLKIPNLTFSNSLTANGLFTVNTDSYKFVRMRASSWTSGTASFAAYGSDEVSMPANRSFLLGSDGTPIGNDGDALKVVNVNPADVAGLDIKYNEISSVASGAETNVISFTATGNGYRVNKIIVSGENIGTYKVKVNGTTVLIKRTYFGGNLNEEFNFEDFENGLKLNATDQIIVTVLHNRPFTGNFEASILGNIL